METNQTVLVEKDALRLKEAKLTYPGEKDCSLHVKDVRLPEGSRCLLLGANGAGKSSLLRLASGMIMQPLGSVTIHDRDAFRDVELTSSGKLVYLGEGWSRGIDSCHGDVRAGDMIDSILASMGTDVVQERMDALVKMLQVDLDWKMSRCSDGQRRRVQICLALLRPYQVLLMDEITVDLDVIARKDLLAYFRKECTERGTTMIYATHIFDGLESWPTHIAHCAHGEIRRFEEIDRFPELKQGRKLLYVVQDWLREDQAIAKEKRDRMDAETREKLRLERAREARRASHMPTRHMAFYR